MNERMRVQKQVMQDLNAVKTENGQTVPSENFQEVAAKFARAWEPGKSVQIIENEIKLMS